MLDRSRRGFLGQLATLPLIGGAIMGSEAALAASPDSELMELCRKLDAVNRFCVEHEGDELFEELFDDAYREHWRLRGVIEASYVTGPNGLKAKAAAVEIAYEWDQEVDCFGNGSFISLARSLAADIRRITPHLERREV